MNTLKVSHKLALGFAAVLALTLAVALIGSYGMDALISRSDRAQSAARLLDEANREDRASSSLAQGNFQALDSDASFHGVLFDGGAFGGGAAVGSEEEAEYLGIPGLLDADQVSALLRERQSRSAQRNGRGGHDAPQAPAVPDHRRLKDLRSQLSKNVSAWSARTGTPHGVIHNELRTKCGGPAVAQASEDQLTARIALLQRWFIGRK